jgi:hypothetical protein
MQHYVAPSIVTDLLNALEISAKTYWNATERHLCCNLGRFTKGTLGIIAAIQSRLLFDEVVQWARRHAAASAG